MDSRFATFRSLLATFWLAFLLQASAQIGGLDTLYASGILLNGASAGSIRAHGITSSGQSVIAGDFTTLGGVPRGRIAKLNANGTLDTAFATGAGANGIIHAIEITADGKILIGGEFTQFDGVARNRIARLTAAGILDTTFNPGTGCNAPVLAIESYSTSIFVGGEFTTFNGVTRNRIALLTSAGSLDSLSFNGGTNGPVRAIYADSYSNDLYIGGDFTTAGGFPRSYIASTSLFSGSFSGNLTPALNGSVRAIAVVSSSSGNSMVAVGGDFTTVGTTPRGRLAYFTVDYSGTFSLNGEFNFWLDAPCRVIIPRGTNRVFFGGDFTMVNGHARTRLAAVSYFGSSGSSGSGAYWDIDTGYGESGPNDSIYALQFAPDGKPLIGGTFTNVGGTSRSGFARLYGDAGSAIPVTPTSPTAAALSDTQIYVQWGSSAFADSYALDRSDDGVSGWAQAYSGATASFTNGGLVASSTKHYRVRASNSNGSSAYTATFSASTTSSPWTGSGSVLAPLPVGMVNGTVSAIARQADGKIVIAGSFTSVLGIARKYIARLHPDLTLDTSFDPGIGANSTISQIELGLNGSIYIFGSFSSVSGVTRSDIARLNSNGSLDTAFDTESDWTFSDGIRAQADGKLIVFGNFDVFFGAPASDIARLNLDGSLDTSFTCTLSSFVDTLALQSDGKMVIAGWFSTINGSSRPYFARVDGSGALDSTHAGSASIATIYGLASLPDGRHYASGSFTTISGVARKYLARLNANGSVDSTFDPGLSTSTATPLLFPQPDGKLVIAGSFTNFAGTMRWKIARLNNDGTLDATFNAEAASGSGSINSILTLPDSSLLVGGSFTTFGVTIQSCLVRLKGDGNPSAPSTPFNFIGESVSKSVIRLTWASLPIAYSWKLERSPDGASGWQQIAEPSWSTLEWLDSGLATGTTYFYRIRSSNSAGESPYSGVISVRTLKSYEQWKIDTGYSLTEPDTSDYDNDGIGLLIEYALSLDPSTPQLDGVPTMQIIGGAVAMSYFRYRSELAYSVETSTDLASWTAVGVNQGSGAFPIAWTLINGAPQKYLRLRVTVP